MVLGQSRFCFEVNTIHSGILNTVLAKSCIIACCCVVGCTGVSSPVSPGESDRLDDLLNDDLSDPGIPADKTSWIDGREVGLQSEQRAEAAFYYDDIDYYVESLSLHGTKVTVAIHNNAIRTVVTTHSPAEFAEAIFIIFHEAWHVFGGFPLDGYVFKIRDPDDPRDLELSQGGVVLDAVDYDTREQAHEVIHAWNGKTFQYEPDGSDNVFQLETWITEGTTIYLSNIIDGKAVDSAYEDSMVGLWMQYLDRIGTRYDVSYAELAANGSATFLTGGEWNTMLGAKGNALNYLFDRELRAAGSSIQEVMQHLYINFGLTDIRFTQADVEAAVVSLTGQPLEDFFERYLKTGAPLTEVLNGSFPLLE